MFPRDIQFIISNYLILDFIPLDKFLHFIVGIIITLLVRMAGFRIRYSFLLILITCVVKEVIDIKTLDSKLSESILDTVVTFFYPVLVLSVKKIKEKAQASQS